MHVHEILYNRRITLTHQTSVKNMKYEVLSQKEPRWTEKRLQYDLFREA